MIDAKSDLDAAKLLLNGEIYSRSIYHTRQAAAQAMKPCLALAGIIITDDHRVSDRFADIFREMPVEIVRDAKFLEHQGTRSGYPLFRDPSRSIWIPSREYTRDDAAGAYRKADRICSTIAKLLEDKYGVVFGLMDF